MQQQINVKVSVERAFEVVFRVGCALRFEKEPLTDCSTALCPPILARFDDCLSQSEFYR